MAKHNELGKKGEEIARRYLEQKGYIIAATNWRFDKDEIDIVAWQGSVLVIVEVKTASTDYFGAPEEAVDAKKEAFLIRATEAYLEEHDLDCESRFDIVAIVLNDRKQVINHIEEAFYPE
ncbi:MAG: YraN family protein [Bacteroidetes bacterium]|jgi:putative endonuclease|nr:YraN family protein [Bacteroidota bacterium]